MIHHAPEKVAEGLRDYIAWECHYPASVDVSPGPGYFNLTVTMDPAFAVPTPRELERDLADLVPKGFHVTMNWTNSDERTLARAS